MRDCNGIWKEPCCKFIVILLQVNILIVTTSNHFWEDTDYTPYLKDPSNDPTSCEDFTHGCCEIYPTCHFEEGDNSTLHVDEIELNFEIGFKKTVNGVDCPRLDKIVRVYNSLEYESAYELLDFNKGCLETESMIDCCSLDGVCDERYHSDFIMFPYLHEGNYKSLYNSIYNGSKLIVLGKLHPNNYYRCPTLEHIINVYQREMLSKKHKEESNDLRWFLTFYIIQIVSLITTFAIIIPKTCCKRIEHQHTVIKNEMASV